ncbi:MAG TPA: hypothetical protein PKO36_01315 [Candidatus Hydrogenedentes bacterium]|nr:hypothetical protein [Candidatus Hydrogenedentota bacterium]HOV75322.1 hypothetical protein [Candidatus Hydrogenedentota bacterium]
MCIRIAKWRRFFLCAISAFVSIGLVGAAPAAKPSPKKGISGKVKTSKGGLAGVCLMGLPGNPVTDKNGEYAVLPPPGWTGSIVPALWGYRFTPAAISYTAFSGIQTQDFYAVPQVCTISGAVMKDGKGLAGVAITGLPGNPTTDAKGHFVSQASPGWSAVVAPSHTGHTFTPSSYTFQDLRGDFCINFDAFAKAAPAKAPASKRK